jgi:HEPN domain-containing protein
MEAKFLLAGNWFLKAENDLRNAELVMQAEAADKPYDTVCYHGQQAAEKYLKGFLTVLDITPLKTHNIEVLMDLLAGNYPDIESLHEAVSLTAYAVENRYPDDYQEISCEEAREALRIAVRVKDFVMEKLRRDHPAFFKL